MKKALVFSGQFWDWPFKVGIHYLTEHLIQEGYKVHFITVGNSCLSFPIAILGSGSRLRVKSALRFLLKGGTIIEGKIVTSSLFSLYHPIKLHSPFLDKYLEFLQYRQFTKNFIAFAYPRLHQLLKKTNFEDFDIVMLESGFATVVWDHIHNKSKIIYRIADDIDKLGYANYFITLEERIIRHADIVLAASKPIYEKAKRIKGEETRIWQLPNGADLRLFSKTAPLPIEYENIKHPRVIFVGNTNLIDLDFLLQAVRLLPEVSFIIIGPKPKINRKYSNLFILGPRNKSLLPSYTKHADIGIIPFSPPKSRDMERPIKFYDYLASGLPIVSTNFDNAQSMEPYAKLANDVDEFVEAIRESFPCSDKDRKKQIQAAQQFSWDAIYRRFDQILSHMMES